MQKTKNIPSEKLSEKILLGMNNQKAEEVIVMDLRGIQHAIADFFVICTAKSVTQSDAIIKSIEKEVKRTTLQTPWRTEGKENGEWVLMDYVDVVVHIFNPEKRKHYHLEDLWGDAQIKKINPDIDLVMSKY